MAWLDEEEYLAVCFVGDEEGKAMKFILTKGEPPLKEADILVRVYEAQGESSEKEQCVGEVLFRSRLNRDHIRFTAWLPRGLVSAIKNAFKSIKGNFTVQISNELPDQIGALTSCQENFDIRLRNEFLSQFKAAK